MELVKILKSKQSSPLYQLLNRLKRNENRFLTPEPSHNFMYKALWLWNSVKKVLDLEKCGLDSNQINFKGFFLMGTKPKYGKWVL